MRNWHLRRAARITELGRPRRRTYPYGWARYLYEQRLLWEVGHA